jgi:TIR domain
VLSKIFISHSSQDEKLARNLMDMLQTQFNLKREDFFLTSDEELEVGGNWIEEIRKGVEEAKIILPIITPNFIESQFCLCELGAAWVNQKALVPIIVPPLNHSALQSTPYRTWVQVITLSTIKDLSRLAEAMIKRDVGNVNIVRFTTRSEGFYTETLEPYIKSLEQREPVTAETFNSLNLELQEFKQAYSEVEKELSIAKTEIEQLRKMKNSEEIQAFDFARLDDWETFTISVENTKKELTPLSNLVTSILFHARKHRSYNGFIGDSDDLPALRVEENKGFIKWDEGWIPDYEHPAILRANNAMEELSKVIVTLEEDEVFRQKFNEVYKDIRLDLSFTPFWEEVLDQTIYHSSR